MESVDMEKNKAVIISTIVVLGVVCFIFWIFFGIISYRRAIYSFESVGNSCGRDRYELYDEKDGVRYFVACFDEVNVIEERFIFKYRYPLTKYIDNGTLLGILQKTDIYKWAYDDIIQTDYSVNTYPEENSNLLITKCQVGEYTDYYIHKSQSNTFCRYLYQ